MIGYCRGKRRDGKRRLLIHFRASRFGPPLEVQETLEHDGYSFRRGRIGQPQMDDVVAAQCHRQRRPVQWQGNAPDAAPLRLGSDAEGLVQLSRSILAGISIPTLVVVGAEDALTPPVVSEAMASAIPGARLTTIPGAGHLAPMERPGAVAAALSDFFAAALPPA